VPPVRPSWCRPIKVLFSTAVDARSKAAMTRTVERLGGSVAADGDPDFSHFVLPTPPNAHTRIVQKSFNTLLALAAGAQRCAGMRLGPSMWTEKAE
jgi:hypothetical protein